MPFNQKITQNDILVSANDAPDSIKSKSDYVCNSIGEDDIIINEATQHGRDEGELVYIAGGFSLEDSIILYGTDALIGHPKTTNWLTFADGLTKENLIMIDLQSGWPEIILKNISMNEGANNTNVRSIIETSELDPEGICMLQMDWCSIYHDYGTAVRSDCISGIIQNLSLATSRSGATRSPAIDIGYPYFLLCDNVQFGMNDYVFKSVEPYGVNLANCFFNNNTNLFDIQTGSINVFNPVCSSNNRLYNGGNAVVASGSLYVTVTHGLKFTPTPDQIKITPTNLKALDWWVSNITATTFRINVTTDPGVSTATFGWRIEY